MSDEQYRNFVRAMIDTALEAGWNFRLADGVLFFWLPDNKKGGAL